MLSKACWQGLKSDLSKNLDAGFQVCSDGVNVDFFLFSSEVPHLRKDGSRQKNKWQSVILFEVKYDNFFWS